MRMIRLVLPACLVLAVPPVAAAAQSTPPSTAAAGWTGDLPAHFAGITLSDAQKAQIVALQRQYHARMEALRDSAQAAGASSTENPELQTRLRAVMAEEHAAFRALLDDAGRARFDANMAQMHAGEHGAAKGAAPAGGAHGAGHGAGHGSRPPKD